MPERQFALIKLSKGDYLLPGNDAKTLYRLHSYIDGPSGGLDPEQFPTDQTYWVVRKWHREISPEVLEFSPPNPDNPDEWEHVEEWFPTRAKAIEHTLEVTP